MPYSGTQGSLIKFWYQETHSTCQDDSFRRKKFLEFFGSGGKSQKYFV